MNDENCAREDLRLVVDVPSYWGVNADGSIDLSDCYGEGDADTDNFDAYHCSNCDEWFTGKHELLVRQQESAWKDALEHLVSSAQEVV